MLHSGVGVLRSGQAEADRFFKKAYRLARVNELVELLLALDVDDASGSSLSHVVVVVVVVLVLVVVAWPGRPGPPIVRFTVCGEPLPTWAATRAPQSMNFGRPAGSQ